MQTLTSPLILVDGSSYLFRAFHALPALSTSSGQPTGAIKGVVSMIKKLIKDYHPTHMAVVFDAKGKTFRHNQYEHYKAHRPPMPEALQQQIEPIHSIIKALGLPLLIEEGVEADDVIGCLVEMAKKENRPVLISTGDKDMAQLVTQDVHLINTMNDQLLNPQTVEEKFGIPPELMIDYLALVGDKVDNIPGVPGVGEKTAVTLLQQLGGIQKIYDNLDKVGELGIRGGKSLAEKLTQFRDQLDLSYQLASIQCNINLKLTLDDLAIQPQNDAQLTEYFKTLEFKGWLEELLTEAPDADPVEYDVITDKEALARWVDQLKAAGQFAVDTETTSLNYMEAEIVGLSFAIKSNQAIYIPVAHDYLGAPEQLERDYVLARLKPLLEDPQLKKIGQNIKYDMSVLARYDIHLQGLAYDTMLESYVLDSTATRHDMDSLALKYLSYKTTRFEDIAGKGAKQLAFNQIPLEQAAPYAAEDADITLRLHHCFWKKLEAESGLQQVFSDIEMPLVPVLSKIERQGALVNTDMLKEQSRYLARRLSELEKQVHDMAGKVFNLDSPKQLCQILYEKLKLPVLKKTPKGAPSTAEPVLQELALDYPLPKLLLEYRSLSKLKSTYTDKLPELINPHTGRIHTSYHQAVAATGRLSSSDPNLQNIPVRTHEGRKIRQAFISSPGSCLIACDYSQIELRIMAHLSGDSGLVKAFKEGLDIHRATAAEILGVALDQVTDTQRREAKAVNFGLIYGMSAFGLSRQLNVSRQEAQSYIDLYFKRYPGVKDYMESIRGKAYEQGYVETLFGRRLYLPEIRSSNKMRKQAAERTAVNAPMQGTAADIIKRAMIEMDRWIEARGLKTRMIMQVHDELIFEVPKEETDQVLEQAPVIMQSAADLAVPLIVDSGVGENWDQAH